MKRLTVICVGTALLIACAPKPPAERFYGQWTVDVQETIALDPEAKPLNKQAKTHLRRVAKKWMSSIIYTFKRDGTLTKQVPGNTTTARFVVTHVGEKSVNLKVDGHGKTDQITLTYRAGSMLLVGEAKPLVLKRK